MITFNKKLLNLISSDAFIIFSLMLIMLILRIIPAYKDVFTNWPNDYGPYVNFATDDAVYHMRLVHNTLHHFPMRIFFDPYTYFPFGNQIHFGPLFTLFIASLALILGLGHPSAFLVNTVGAFLPPIFAALCLIPTYFLGKKLFNRNAGILATLVLAFLPGEFFQRSALGFTDHHIAEVLFSTLVFTFLVYALDIAKTAMNGKGMRSMLIYSSLAGFSFGLYFLIWPAAVLVGVILFLFFAALFISEFNENHDLSSTRRKNYLIIAAAVFFIPTIMVLPYALYNPRLQLGYYSLTQPIILIMLFAILGIIFFILNALAKYKRSFIFYLMSLLGIIAVATLAIYWFAPGLFNLTIAGIKLLFSPARGMITVSEVWPSLIDRASHGFTLSAMNRNFSFAFPMSLIAILLLLSVWKNKRQDSHMLLIAIWSIIMMLAMFAQIRFTYYFAINAALLTGYLFKEVLTHCDLLFRTDHFFKNNKLRKTAFGSSIILSSVILSYPIFSIESTKALSYGPHLSKEWYDTLIWLKQNTPDPQGQNKTFFYDTGLYRIKKEETKKYPYPNSAYGIMNWWDDGHQITYVAHRIPVSNPFQKGILIEQNNKLGAAPFFTADKEEVAVENLNALGARYVLIKNITAAHQYESMLLWQGLKKDLQKNLTLTLNARKKGQKKSITLNAPVDQDNFFNSMLYKLYYLDGDGFSHLRLVHESSGPYIINAKAINIYTGRINNSLRFTSNNYQAALNLSNKIKKIAWLNTERKQLIYETKPPAKSIKIFECVRGAIIVGDAPLKDTEVSLNLPLLSNDGRLFNYTQNTTSHLGQYKFIVPYPTEAMQGEGYHYDIIPVAKYTIKIGKNICSVAVSESDVKNGNTVKCKI